MGANYRKELEAGGGGTPMIGGNISARGSMQSKADARREIADLNNPKGKRSSDRDKYLAGKGTKSEREAETKEASQKLAAKMSAAKAEGKSFDQAMDSIFGFKKGGKVSSASKRADGCCVRGKTRA
jgi:hypothetical protein